MIRITGDASVSNDSLHSPGSGIYEILSTIDYLQLELARIDSTAGHLLQMCKAELLQKLAMEAMTSAVPGPGKLTPTSPRCPKPMRATRRGRSQWRRRHATTNFRSRDTLTKHDLILPQME